MRKIGLIIVAVLVTLSSVFAQQDPLSSLFVQNPSMVNPAYAGAKGVLSLNAGSRAQWTGVDGAPLTSYFNFSTPLKGESIAVGLNVVNDRIGPVNSNGFFADVSYSLPVGLASQFKVGIRAGLSTFSGNFTSVTTDQSGDPAFSQNVSGELMPNVGVGLYYNSDKFFAGFSIPTLLQNEIKGVNTVNTRTFGKESHMFAMAGVLVDLSADVLLKPAVTARFVPGAPLSIDAQVLAELYEKFGIGLMYRLDDSFAGMAQFMLSEQFKIGYCYDLTTSDFGAYNNGSHEVLLSYDFVYRRSKINSPRYF